MVSATPDRAVRVRALDGRHCAVSLGKTLDSRSAPPHPDIQMGTGEFKTGVIL